MNTDQFRNLLNIENTHRLEYFLKMIEVMSTTGITINLTISNKDEFDNLFRKNSVHRKEKKNIAQIAHIICLITESSEFHGATLYSTTQIRNCIELSSKKDFTPLFFIPDSEYKMPVVFEPRFEITINGETIIADYLREFQIIRKISKDSILNKTNFSKPINVQIKIKVLLPVALEDYLEKFEKEYNEEIRKLENKFLQKKEPKRMSEYLEGAVDETLVLLNSSEFHKNIKKNKEFFLQYEKLYDNESIVKDFEIFINQGLKFKELTAILEESPILNGNFTYKRSKFKTVKFK